MYMLCYEYVYSILYKIGMCYTILHIHTQYLHCLYSGSVYGIGNQVEEYNKTIKIQ